MTDAEVVEAFRNFLSWGVPPATPPSLFAARNVPPAFFAYIWGHTSWCPPKGTL